jgi:hypothetical protein
LLHKALWIFPYLLTCVYPEMEDFALGQDNSFFATPGAPQEMPLGCIALLLPRIAKSDGRSLGPKDAVYGWTLT